MKSLSLSRFSIVGSIIQLNILVFALWFISYYIGSEFMVKNFLVSWEALEDGRVWTLLTSVFSHNMFFHIFINMYVFYGFGTFLENTLGQKRFLIFFLSAGIFSSLCHCLVSAFLLGQPGLPALGASGAISGVILLFSLMFPQEKILLMGIIPMPAIFAAIFFVLIDIWGLVAQSQGGGMPIGHGAHLGGALFGLIYFYVFLRKNSRRQKLFHG